MLLSRQKWHQTTFFGEAARIFSRMWWTLRSTSNCPKPAWRISETLTYNMSWSTSRLTSSPPIYRDRWRKTKTFTWTSSSRTWGVCIRTTARLRMNTKTLSPDRSWSRKSRRSLLKKRSWGLSVNRSMTVTRQRLTTTTSRDVSTKS